MVSADFKTYRKKGIIMKKVWSTPKLVVLKVSKTAKGSSNNENSQHYDGNL